jgi:glycosidase
MYLNHKPMKVKSLIIMIIVVMSVFSGIQTRASSLTQVKHTRWSRNAVIYEANIRQATPEGTFNAYRHQLLRLKHLGVDIIWVMPINPISVDGRKGELGSYYAVQDYTKVNPEFGTLNDFKSLVERAHELGIKVIIDWVANHTGLDNVWMKSHPDFYAKDSTGNLIHPYDWTDTYKLDYTNENLRSTMIAAMKFWIKKCDVDGFRCDVAMEVPTDFWNRARNELSKIKPIFMLAEAEKTELAEKAFDMNYNWSLKNVLGEICKNGKNAQTSLDSLLENQQNRFPEDSYLMNHITNHDLNSWEGTEFDRLGDGVKACAVLTYTLPGMPLIYTGQEVGFNHAFQFFKKDESPDYTPNAYTSFYKALNRLKHRFAALKAGNGGTLVRYPTSETQVYVFSRKSHDGTVTIMVNLSDKQVPVEFTRNNPKGIFTNYFTHQAEAITTQLNPWEYKVYISDRPFHKKENK